MDESRLAQVRDFIVEARKQQQTYDQIRAQLLSSGWSDADVNEYLPTAWQQAEALLAPPAAAPPAQPPVTPPVQPAVQPPVTPPVTPVAAPPETSPYAAATPPGHDPRLCPAGRRPGLRRRHPRGVRHRGLALPRLGHVQQRHGHPHRRRRRRRPAQLHDHLRPADDDRPAAHADQEV